MKCNILKCFLVFNKKEVGKLKELIIYENVLVVFVFVIVGNFIVFV